MALESEIYDRLAAILATSVDAIYDTIRPDGLTLDSTPIVVFQRISSTPIGLLNGDLALQQPQFQVSVYVGDSGLTAARAVRAAIIAGLQGYKGGVIKGCWLVADYEIPPSAEIREYHLPIDFIFTI